MIDLNQFEELEQRIISGPWNLSDELRRRSIVAHLVIELKAARAVVGIAREISLDLSGRQLPMKEFRGANLADALLKYDQEIKK